MLARRVTQEFPAKSTQLAGVPPLAMGMGQLASPPERMEVGETDGISQPIMLKAVPPDCVSVRVTSPFDTAPPLSQTTTWKVTNISPPASSAETRLFVMLNVAGPATGPLEGIVMAWEKKRAPPQLLVL